MHIKTYLLSVFLLFSLSVAHAEENFLKGSVDGVNIQGEFLSANDMSYAFDRLTRVYDADGQLRTIKYLKPGHVTHLYLRKKAGTSDIYPNRMLDKVIYFSK